MKNVISRRLLGLSAATTLVLGAGVMVAQAHFASPAYAKCVGHAVGNPGNDKLVGKAGDHPPGGGGSSITGDRGGSR